MSVRRPDFLILFLYIALIGAGALFVASASYAVAGRSLGNPFYFITRHLVFIVAAVGVFFYAATLRNTTLEKVAVGFYLFTLFLCALVFVDGFGIEVNGARRWLGNSKFSIQPSEFLKIGLILVLSWWLSRKIGDPKKLWPGFIVAMGMIVACVVLVEMQKDLGTSLMMLLIGFSILWAAATPKRYLAAVSAVMAAGVVYLIHKQPYRMERVEAWWNPWEYKMDQAYQVVQSYYAFGQGGWHGTGLGLGQAKYYIPAPHTDFVFATIAEETGLLGPIILIGLFIVLARYGLRVSRDSKTVFGRFASIGVVAFLCGQAALNIAVVTGCVPCTGIPLPFLSYGGSSLVSASIAAGLLFGLSRSTNRRPVENNYENICNRRRYRRPYLPRVGGGVRAAGARNRARTALRR